MSTKHSWFSHIREVRKLLWVDVKEYTKHIKRNIMFIIVYYSVIYEPFIYSNPVFNSGENTTISLIIKLRKSRNVPSIMLS